MKIGAACCVASAAVALGGCSSAGTGGAIVADTSSTPSATVRQWCAAYASLTRVLANADGVPGAGAAASGALDRFDALWARAVDLGLLTQTESEANVRSVAGYRAIVDLRSAGLTDTVLAATEHTSQQVGNGIVRHTTTVVSHLNAKVGFLCYLFPWFLGHFLLWFIRCFITTFFAGCGRFSRACIVLAFLAGGCSRFSICRCIVVRHGDA